MKESTIELYDTIQWRVFNVQ